MVDRPTVADEQRRNALYAHETLEITAGLALSTPLTRPDDENPPAPPRRLHQPVFRIGRRLPTEFGVRDSSAAQSTASIRGSFTWSDCRRRCCPPAENAGRDRRRLQARARTPFMASPAHRPARPCRRVPAERSGQLAMWSMPWLQVAGKHDCTLREQRHRVGIAKKGRRRAGDSQPAAPPRPARWPEIAAIGEEAGVIWRSRGQRRMHPGNRR